MSIQMSICNNMLDIVEEPQRDLEARLNMAVPAPTGFLKVQLQAENMCSRTTQVLMDGVTLMANHSTFRSRYRVFQRLCFPLPGRLWCYLYICSLGSYKLSKDINNHIYRKLYYGPKIDLSALRGWTFPILHNHHLGDVLLLSPSLSWANQDTELK